MFTYLDPKRGVYVFCVCMPGESYRRRLRSLLLSLSYVFQVLINFLVCGFCTSTPCLILFQIKPEFFSCLIRGCNRSLLFDFPWCVGI